MDWQNHIVADSEVLLGKPSIKGTRISVEHIMSLLAQGWSEQKILDNYPRLKQDDLTAVFAYLQYCMRDGLLAFPFKSIA
jgi:uncharacterized protein (DUF433 family)